MVRFDVSRPIPDAPVRLVVLSEYADATYYAYFHFILDALAREAGFETAVTTRKGMLFPEHRRHLTALPRVSLSGDYQSPAYTSVFLSGAPFALWNRFQRVNAA